MLVIDVDRLKTVNDTYGHVAGDAVLVAIADALRAEVGEGDLVGRFGGDEFVVLLSRNASHHISDAGGDGNGGGLRAVANRIRRQVAVLQVEASTPDGAVLLTGMSVSIGGAPLLDHQPDLHTGLQLADTALYEVKRSGRGTVHIAAVTQSGGLQPDRPATTARGLRRSDGSRSDHLTLKRRGAA